MKTAKPNNIKCKDAVLSTQGLAVSLWPLRLRGVHKYLPITAKLMPFPLQQES